MKKIIFLIFVCFSIQSTVVKGQQKSVDAAFNELLHFKRQYEEYNEMAEKRPSYVVKRDSVYKLYKTKIELIRKEPETYLFHIEQAISNNKVKYDGPSQVLYDYVPSTMPFNPDLHVIDRLDLYKIIKKHIFEQTDAILPRRTEAYLKVNGDRLRAPLNN